MISSEHRFHGHGSLRFVYQKGETVRGTNGTLKYILNQRRKTYRLAVVVSRKVSKSAVVRNRIRRRIYEASRDYLANLDQPYDMVMTVYNECVAEAEPAEVQEKVLSYFQRAGILTGPPSKRADRGMIKPKENNK